MRIIKYLINNLLSLRVLMLLLLFQFPWIGVYAIPMPKPSAKSDQTCKEMNVTFEVIKGMTGSDNNSIKIDLGAIKSSSLIISLVGPKKFFLLDIKEDELKNLRKGTYSLVIVGRDKDSDYCPKHFQVIIE